MNSFDLAMSKKHGLIALCLLLGLSGPAFSGSRGGEPIGNQENPENGDETADTFDEMQAPINSLDNEMSIEERIQIRRALDAYSRADPSHIQLEQRRQVMRKQIHSRFFGADKDNDGTLSRLEAIAVLPQIARHFYEIDSNGDDIITMKELEEAQVRAAERRRALEAKIDEARLNAAKEAEIQAKKKNNQASSKSKSAL
jgi:hypothetical protein